MTPKAKDLRRARQSEWARRAERRRWLIIGAWIAAGLALTALIIYLAWKENQPIPRTGEDVPTQSAAHIDNGQSHEPYNSDPPTSGPHYVEPAKGGFYEEAPQDEQLVHNLEHGYVIIWYNCQRSPSGDGALTAGQCDQLKQQLRDTMARGGNSTRTGTPKLIAVPRPTLDTQLALTTWGRLDKFEAFDQNRILNFIRAFRDHAPEPNAP
jgi:hypothetical protein